MNAMGTPTIAIRDAADLGPVLARADHLENTIEVNAKVFYRLPPMMQEFVLCHEVCHLKHNEWDEARTNQLATELFLRRAKGEADLEQRKRFMSYVDGHGGYSNLGVEAILAMAGSVFSLGTSIFGIIRQRNSGWYSWDISTQRANLKTLLTQAFEQSRKSSRQSAAEFFWAQIQAYTAKDSSLDQFLRRTANEWVNNEIAKYEKAYGFGFTEVTPIDLTAFPMVIIALGALVGFAVYKIIKNRMK